MEAGQGRCTVEDIKKALVTGERGLAGPTAPPQGLMLVEIREV